MSTAVVAALVILVVVASIAALSLYLGSHPRPTARLVEGSGSSYNYDSSVGLNLTLSVTPLHAAQGVFVSINVSIVNPSQKPIVLRPSNATMKASAGPCSQLPLGVGILQGNYGPRNFSESTPLTTFYPGIYHCPAEFNIDSFSFAPRSSNVTIHIPEPEWTYPAEIKAHAWGFWSVSGSSCSPPGTHCPYPGPFRSFPPGLYTALAQDQWGQAAVEHFEVTEAYAFASCSSVTSSSSFIKHPVGTLSSGPFAVSAYYVDKFHNGSVFLPLTNNGSSPMMLMAIEDARGQFLYNYQGNAFPPASYTWYAETPGEPLEYPFSATASACTLLHMDFTGSSFLVGIELRFLFAGYQDETIILKGS